jgi:nucleotide-binding universal stress UspA family protein
MIELRRLLCPVDFSEHSRRALRHAMAIASRHESQVTVLHVEDMLLGAARAEVSLRADLMPGPEAELRVFVEETGVRDLDRVEILMLAGDAVGQIIEQASRGSSDLIVMGSRGRSGMARAVMESVTERVLRRARCPVMTIPPAAPGPAMNEVVEAFGPILCASDFSPSCRKALDLALSMAQDADARLILLHALQWPTVVAGIMPLPATVEIPIDRAELRREILVRLKRGLPGDAAFRCRPETIVVPGHPSETILRVADDQHVNLIVMGVHSRSAIDRLLFGSTTRQVIQAARCPVLSIRADEHDEPWVGVPYVTRLSVSV